MVAQKQEGEQQQQERKRGEEAKAAEHNSTETTLPTDEAIVAEGSKLVTAFHTAAKAGDTAALAKLLLSSAPSSTLLLNAHEPKAGMTALHIACRAGVPTTLAWLLEKGASVLVIDTEGYTPLDHARAKPHNAGCLECVHLLQEHIREQPPAIKEIGPLLASFFEAPLDKAWMDWALDHYGPPLIDSKGRDHRSPLHLAVTHNDAAVLEELLEMGADPFVKDREGKSPLDLVMMSGNIASIQALSRAMKTQLVAFMGLALLFFLYRRGGDPQQAWVLLATLWPLGKTCHLLVLGREQGAARGRALGEWLTYWALLLPIFLLEHAVTTHLLPSPALQQLMPFRSEDGKESITVLRTLTDVYMIVKIVGTLYLIYPASRGARKVFRWLEGRREGGRGGRVKKGKEEDDGKKKKEE